MTIKQFISKWQGKEADWDGAYAGQCVDLFRYYCHEVLEIRQPDGVWGAANFWTEFETDEVLQENFIKIPNTADFTPNRGDVMVWNFNAGGGFGHIGMCTGDNEGLQYFKSFDQNWSRISFCEIVNHNYRNVYGVLRPTASNTEDMQKLLDKYSVSSVEELDSKLEEHVGLDWGNENNEDNKSHLASERRKTTRLEEQVTELEGDLTEVETLLEESKKEHNTFLETLANKLSTIVDKPEIIASVERLVGRESELESKLKQADQAYKELQESKRVEMDKLREEIVRLKDKNEELEEQVKKQDKHIETLSNRLKKLEDGDIPDEGKRAFFEAIESVISSIRGLFTKGK